MAKLVVGKSAPKSFPLKAQIPTPGGMDEINFEAKHFPSTVWAKMREAHAEAISKTVQSLFEAARKDAEAAFAADAKKPKKMDDEAKEAAIVALVKPVKESEIASLRAKHSAELIAQIMNTWDLDEPLGVPALTDMCDMYPGAAEAVFKAYNETREGLRLGN